jgi:Tfp pilus assembly protein PilF
MGAYYQLDRNIQKAEEEYREVIRLNKDFPNVHNNLG